MTKPSNQKIRVKWRPLCLNDPPRCSGIYAIRSGETWLYIGRSINIARRISDRKHPVQITKGLTLLVMQYFYFPKKEKLGSLEHKLIKFYNPEWNGGTSFDSSAVFVRTIIGKDGVERQTLSGPVGPFCNILISSPGDFWQ